MHLKNVKILHKMHYPGYLYPSPLYSKLLDPPLRDAIPLDIISTERQNRAR